MLPIAPFRPRLIDALKGYDSAHFAKDFAAGLTVAVVALPLAMAFAIASGLKPEAGLFTAIIAGFLISALGGSRVQIGGPAGAFIVIVYGIVQQYGVGNLIIATANGNKKETVVQLERLGFPVYVINPVTFDNIFETIRHIGQITGRTASAEELVAKLTERVKTVVSVTSGLEKPRVLYQIGIDPLVTVGKNTVHNTLITLAGGSSITGDVAVEYPRLSMEKVVFAQPDIIIVSSMKRGGNFRSVRDMWKQWKDIPAVKNDRIHIINSDLTDHSSPRIVDGLEELVRIIHPGLMTGNRRHP